MLLLLQRFYLYTVKVRVNELAKKIHAQEYSLPTYGFSEHSGRPHIEINDRGYHWVVCERGEELERRTTRDLQELLYWIFTCVTFEMASEFELNNRNPEMDSRRILFQKQLELLKMIDESFAAKQQVEIEEILKNHPYRDPRDGQ